MNSEAAINYISFYILKKMSDADRDEILDSPMGKAKSFVVCPQSMFGEIIGSDDEDWIPPKASYSVIEKLEAAPSQFNHNIVAIDSNFRKVFVKELKTEALQEPAWIKQVEKQFELHHTLVHPNIIRVIEQNYAEKKIILEFMNQANYFEKNVIEKAKPIQNIIKLKSYIHDIASGLAYLHSQNLVHADVRLETAHCCKGKQDIIRTVKLGDFGNLQRRGDELTKFHVDFIKKRQILAPPELQVGLKADFSLDIWCLGIVVHMMAVAYAPNSLPQNLQIVDRIAFLKSHWSQHEPELFKLVKAMLQVDPSKRPTAEQILANGWLSQ